MNGSEERHIRRADRPVCRNRNAIKKEKLVELVRLEPGFPVLRKAVPAVDGASFGRLKGDFTLFTTV
jgi:hypothetical protein